MKLGLAQGHTHIWNSENVRTSAEDGHSHTVKNPKSGWTDGAGKNNHKHKIILKVKKR